MGDYLMTKDLPNETTEDGITVDVCIFREDPKHFRVIFTANNDDFGMGTTTKSFKSGIAAGTFVEEEDKEWHKLKDQAIEDLREDVRKSTRKTS